MSNTANNVTAAKPKIAGAIYRAPLGTTLPTTADETLNSAFKGLGYVSDDGVTNNNSPSSEDIKAWGGAVVYTALTEKPDKFKFKMIEALNTDVLKTVYGSSNVSGDLSTGIAVHAKVEDSESASYVIDMLLKNNVLKRLVIPNASISEMAEIVYKDNEVIGYDVTLSAVPDSGGATHHDYTKQVSGQTGET